MPSTIVNVTGERVALGPLRRDLLETYQRWSNDFETDRTQGDLPGPRTIERAERWYERVTSSSDQVWFLIYERAALEQAGDALAPPVGLTWLSEVDHRNRTAGFAISIAEAAARGKGYGTEAARLMLDYAFTALGLHNVMLEVFEFNLAGRRAYEKAGFRECARRRESVWMGGRLWDTIYMDCLATEFTSPVLGAVFVPDEPR